MINEENRQVLDETCEKINEIAQDTAFDYAEDNMDDSIQLRMSTGEVYLVDPNTFDWDNAIANLDKMIENEATLHNLMFTLLGIDNPNEEDTVEYIDNSIRELENFMDNLQIHPDYEKFDPNISKYKKLVFMVLAVVELNERIKRVLEETKPASFSELVMISGLTHGTECSCEECNSSDPVVEEDAENDGSGEPTSYHIRIVGDLKNPLTNYQVESCEVVDYISPDEYDIPEISVDNAADLIHFEVVVFSEIPDDTWAKDHAICIYKREMTEDNNDRR